MPKTPDAGPTTRASRTRVKVCCIANADEAARAVALGADAVGLVGAMPSGPGVIGDDLAAALAATVGPPTARFLLTSQVVPEAIADQVERCGVDTVQLVDRTTPDTRAALRRLAAGVRVVQVVHVVGDESVAEAVAAADEADALLLDSGRPDLPVKELGGTGRVHDWRLSRAIVEAVHVPVFLAGGLRPDNVADALRAVRPFGVDVCSGVRAHCRLDEARLRGFVAACRRADRQLAAEPPPAGDIFHLVPLSELRAGLRDGAYWPARFGEDGFVHCSGDVATTLAVAHDVFAGADEPLVVLALDPAALTSEVVLEAPAPLGVGGTSHRETATRFPHVYGPLDESAVRGAAVVPRRAGGFAWPDELGPLAAVLTP